MKDRTMTTPPAPSQIRPFSVPEPRTSRLASGVGLDLVVLDRLPLVSVQLVVDVGESRVPHADAGIASMTAATLQGGAGDRTGEELAEALEGIGASLGVSAGWETTRVSLACLPERLATAFAILADVTLRPTFPDGEVKRSLDQRLAQIDHEMSDPRSLGNQSAVRYIYAEGEPFGRRAGGERTSITALDRDRLQEFHAQRFGGLNAHLIVVGDFDVGEVTEMADSVFGDWAPQEEAGPPPTCAPRESERHIWVVNRPGAVQSEIRIGHVGIARSAPDYFPLRVFNAVLGGTFTSRLNLNLREEHGFTYGVRSQFAPRRTPGPFTIGAAVETPVTADAVREAMKEMTLMADAGPTEDEVAAVRDYLSGVFPLQWETTAQTAARIADQRVYGLPPDYWRTYRDQIRAVTRESAHAAGRANVRPAEAQIVVVGDADKVREPLQALELGPVSVVEPA